jgi:hypothetical protein
MATQQIVSSVSTQQKSAVVVPFPAPPQSITQLELAALLSLRGRLHQLEEQVTTAEQSIQARLEAGSSVECGDHVARLKTNSRRNVAWKEVAVRLAERLKLDGDLYCARVLAATKPTKSISLVVE